MRGDIKQGLELTSLQSQGAEKFAELIGGMAWPRMAGVDRHAAQIPWNAMGEARVESKTLVLHQCGHADGY